VFASCDVTAMGVLQALREAGRRVADDVAVVGFDGSAPAEAADLSSVYMPVEDEATSAGHHLLDPSLPPPGRLPTTLTVRGSSWKAARTRRGKAARRTASRDGRPDRTAVRERATGSTPRRGAGSGC
jgi:hypothetical protein